ncbi:UDP-glucose/GDP-mannose dehydrogenase family protein [Pseudomonas sp. BN417]|uniref:UDP-glucose dehydrogenase family protein n=1 Tax=Pseudomonas sp. BN417 TaxID=2567890 RepID=UPI0024564A51|nr:UDP-glucose/GDP-mannose dehydrogenase family protein [Pseudomonas sp. BN417]MDH4558279.1 UDP-glucose/GDP-mannose dehydrogenase family protein [Pseudomonas sp. BN417]
MDVSVFGTGYVGLAQAAALADVGHRVLCVDIDEKKIQQLRKAVPPIQEPGLSALIDNNLREGRLSFSTRSDDAVTHGQLIFIALGTPADEDGSADLRRVLCVAREVVRHMEVDRTLVIKSTVPVGTAARVLETAREALVELGKGHLKVRVVSNPEFLMEGNAVNDCARPDRIIVGSEDEVARSQLAELYAPFCHNHDKLIFMDNRSAELTKYAANAMLVTRISLMNELANLAKQVGADIESVRKGIGSDPRIGFHYIHPGCGFGGSCSPKDLRSLLHTCHMNGFQLRLLRAVHEVNEEQRQVLFRKLQKHYPDGLEGKSIAVWGLAFKPDTDDMREAPIRYLLEALWHEGATVRAFDPEAMSECRRLYGYRDDLVLCATRDDTVQDADALVICTEWKAFRVVDFEFLASKLRDRLVIDGRNLYNPEQVTAAGLHYQGIGLPRIVPLVSAS